MKDSQKKPKSVNERKEDQRKFPQITALERQKGGQKKIKKESKAKNN